MNNSTFGKSDSRVHLDEQFFSKEPYEPLLVNLTRVLHNSGFHRELETKITIPLASNALPLSNMCKVALAECLSRDVFVDYDEVAELKRLNFSGFERFHFLADRPIDTEKPAYLSQSHVVFVFSHQASVNDTKFNFVVTFPIHFRYQTPSEHLYYTDVNIFPPIAYLMCPTSNGTEFMWFLLNYGDFWQHVVRTKIPVGQLWLRNFVTFVTFSVVLLGSLSILVTLLRTKYQ
jgi:hypothetical protein